jgi:hypothetical protein
MSLSNSEVLFRWTRLGNNSSHDRGLRNGMDCSSRPAYFAIVLFLTPE